MTIHAPGDDDRRAEDEWVVSEEMGDDFRGAGPGFSKLNLVLISQATGTASLIEWAKLALKDITAPVLRVSRIRHDDQFGALTEEIVVSLTHFPGFTDRDTFPDIAALAQRYGLSLGTSTERIGFVPAPANVARHLGIAVGKDIVKLERITETIGGDLVEWRIAHAWKAL
jgi:DNA-binding GntR family transcriptional regulator